MIMFAKNRVSSRHLSLSISLYPHCTISTTTTTNSKTSSHKPKTHNLKSLSVPHYKESIFLFLFATMSLLAELVNLDLSDTSEKIIAEYIWFVFFLCF